MRSTYSRVALSLWTGQYPRQEPVGMEEKRLPTGASRFVHPQFTTLLEEMNRWCEFSEVTDRF